MPVTVRADVFSVIDGRKLCLDDLFFVTRDEYLPVLHASILSATMCFSQDYDSARDEEFRPTFHAGIIDYTEVSAMTHILGAHYEC